MALALAADALLLDEPTAGMSLEERRVTGELLSPIKRHCSILIVEHDLDFIRDVSDVLTVLDQGSVLDSGPVDASARAARSRRSISAVSEPPRVRAVLAVHSSRPTTARARSCSTSTSQVGREAAVAVLGRNGAGKTTLMKTHHGRAPAAARPHRARRARPDAHADRAAGAVGPRLRAAGARGVRPAHRPREPGGRSDGRARSVEHRRDPRAVSEARPAAPPGGGDSERRGAQDAGGGPGPLDAARSSCCSTSPPRASGSGSSRRSPSGSRSSPRASAS